MNPFKSYGVKNLANSPSFPSLGPIRTSSPIFLQQKKSGGRGFTGVEGNDVSAPWIGTGGKVSELNNLLFVGVLVPTTLFFE